MAEVVLDFKVERETKNTVRFAEAGDGPPIVGSLYVQKWWVKGAHRLRVTIEKVEEE